MLKGNEMATRKKKRRKGELSWDRVFNVGSWRLGIIVALTTFVTAWVYCTIHYGFLFGFGLGWLPAGMLAATVGTVSWLVSLLLTALWRDPELLVWLPLALLATWLIWRRREDVGWLGRRLDRRRKLKSRGKGGGFLTALTALSTNAERTQKSSQATRPPKELLH